MSMSLRVWSEQVVPRLTDWALDSDQVAPFRDRVCQGLHGRVLELGFGSGLNIAHYPAEVTAVGAVEPAEVGWALSRRRRRLSAVPVGRAGLDGQHLADADECYDAALVTFSLCSIPDAGLALREVRRVLRRGGRLHFLEHGLAPDEPVRRWQRRLEPLQQRVFAGCHLTRDVPAMMRAAGFEIEWLEQAYVPGPALSRPWTFGSLGVARA